MHPSHLPGRHNRDFDATPHQAWGRSGQGYGRTGPVEYEPWDHPYGKWGGSHPLVTWGGVGLLVFGLGLICVGMGWW